MRVSLMNDHVPIKQRLIMKMRQSKIKIKVIGIIFLLFFSAIAYARPQDEATTVRIGYLNITASLPLFIAEDQGYFSDEKINYQTFPIATSNQLVDGIIADNIDVFIESSAVPVLAVQSQAPGRLKVFSVSAITKKAPFDAILVKDGSPIASLQELARKKIGVFPGSTATTLLKKYFSDSGIDVSGITFVPIPPQNQITSLLAGNVDALHAYEPTIAIGMEKGLHRLYGSVYADMLEPNPQGVAVISTKFLNDHPSIASKIISVLEHGMVFMREDETEARKILAKRLNLEASVANRSGFLYMLPHNEIDSIIFQKYADMLVSLGEINGNIDVNSLLYREKPKTKSYISSVKKK